MVEIIEKLNEKQKQSVRDIGFGGLLELKIKTIPKAILPWLIDAFNERTGILKISKGKEFEITKDDVYDIFLLPRVGEDVEVIQTGHCKATPTDNLKEEWRVKFGIGGTNQSIKLNDVSKRLQQTTDDGDDFKKMFVLYSMSTFLSPTSNHCLDFKLLKAVEDVEKIKEYNWSKYVCEQFLGGIASFKDGSKYLGGCILVLMLTYMHRMEFNGVVESTELPLIRHWSDEKLSERVHKERKLGSIGKGVMTKTLYPICLNEPNGTIYSF